MGSGLFRQVAIFVAVLVALRLLFGWQISVVGSLVVTAIVYMATAALSPDRRADDQESD
ncbi:MAG: hypothetical protein R3258_05530 [Acidimicrobiia bacterium]|nr:hypothetical protein [Acidimicrobiia bacterium]